jgi:hypothetical protein
LFAGRTDDFALPFIDDAWARAGRPVTVERVRAALTHVASPMSFYLVDALGLVRCPAIDFDTDGVGVRNARTAARWLRDQGVASLVEPSRNKRAHLFVPLDASVQVSVAHRFLLATLDGSGIDRAKVEVFPKSDRAPAPGQVGSCLRGPLMTNPKNGRSYPLLDPVTMKPLADAFEETIAAIVPASAERVIELAGPQPEPEERADRETPEHIRAFDYEHPCSEVLRDLWHLQNAESGRSVRCPAHDDLHPSLSVFADDKRVLCWSPDCLFNNGGRGRDAFDLFVLAPMPEAER